MVKIIDQLMSAKIKLTYCDIQFNGSKIQLLLAGYMYHILLGDDKYRNDGYEDASFLLILN